ncbi:MAG TPA: hypothetical protein DCS15_01295 [Flavobacteriales bacterium]|nr:hypothetical protein [Flavobacteriales bacterium]
MVDQDKLRDLAVQFPFAAALQNEVLKRDFLTQDEAFEESLRKAALRSTDREHLFELIFQSLVQEKVEEIDEVLSKDLASSVSKEKEALQAQLEQQINSQAAELSFQRELIARQKEQRKEETPSPQVIPIEQKEQISPSEPTKRSFTDWIRSMEEPKRRSSILKEDLIKKFIDNEPSLNREKKSFFKPEEMSKLSILEDEEFVTETLAGLYANQGHTEKAIRAYEILQAHNPEKSGYFAALISELKKK